MQFLARPDFFSVLHTNSEAMELYNRNTSLKYMISKVRREPRVFPRYEHNRDLVALVNFFAEQDKELPAGYESKLDRTGKVGWLDDGVLRIFGLRGFSDGGNGK